MLAHKLDHLQQSDDVAHIVPFLNKLRFLSFECRASARLDLFQACSVLDLDSAKASDNYARILVRVIGQALDKPMEFLAPGSEIRTFDEDWLLRVLDCRMRNDTDSYLFLLMRRVPAAKRSSLDLLLKNIALQEEI